MGKDERAAVAKPSDRRALVYGGGVAGLTTTLQLALRGVAVDLVGPVPAGRWPCLSEAGINAGADDAALYRQTIAGGGYLAPRPPVRTMAKAASALVPWLASLGVPFRRDERGALAWRRLDGAAEPDAAFVEGQTAAQITYALDDQVARLGAATAGEEASGPIVRYDHFELVALVLSDGGRCIGIVAQDLVSMDMVSMAADAVVLATGGPECMFGSPSGLCSESAAAVALEAGAVFANADLVQHHPATIGMPEGRRYVLSSAFRAETGRFWVPRDAKEARLPRDIPNGDRDFFLAEAHPGFGDLVPDDVAARAVRRICRSDKRGVYDPAQRANRPVVYCDVSHLPAAAVADRLGSEAAACLRLTGVDPAKAPLQVDAAATLALGGLWVDFEADADGELVEDSPRNHHTSIQGLFAASGAGHLYHGHCRLGGNGLLADVLGGQLTARAVGAYCERQPAVDAEAQPFVVATDQAAAVYAALLERPDDDDGRTPAELAARLRAAMGKLLGSEPTRSLLELARKAIAKVGEQAATTCPDDWCDRANRGVPALRDLERMLRLAEMVVASTEARLSDDPDRPQTVLARLEGDAIVALDGFTCVRGGEALDISRVIDPEDVPPAPRRDADAGGTAEDEL